MIKKAIMESEDTKSPAPAATPTEAKKPRTRKTAKPAAEKTPATARKPRTRKTAKTETPAANDAAPAPAPVVSPAPAPAEMPESKTTESKPKVRRVKVKAAPAKKDEAAASPAQSPAKEPALPAPKAEDLIPEPQPRHDRSPEPAPGFALPETVGGNEGSGNAGKRRRRRNRNRRGGDNQPQNQPFSQPKVDPQELVRRAWKIFLGEVTEEGLALMDDRTAAEASRRAFRVAELFLQEAARHKPTTAAPLPESESLPGDEAEDEAPAE